MIRSHLNVRALLAAIAMAVVTVAVIGCGSNGAVATSASTASGGHDMHNMTADNATTAQDPADGHAMEGHSMGGSQTGGMTGLEPGADGTSASAGGLTLKPRTRTIAARRNSNWVLQVVDAKGVAVTRFERDQTKLMHLIVVRDDLSGFQHLHPALGKRGRFSVTIKLPVAGRYRAIADFVTGGKRYALGTTLTAPGASSPVPLPAPSNVSKTDGYTVTLSSPSIQAGKEAALTFAVARRGVPERRLQPYLGAFGHLVALDSSDLAYSHVHPVAHKAAAGTVSFAADFVRAGTYRTYLQFRAGGAVHTAAFTVEVK